MPLTDTQKWNKLLCDNPICREIIGLTDSVSVIVGNCLITQPKIPLVCPKCHKIKKFSSTSTEKIIRLIPENEVAKLLVF